MIEYPVRKRNRLASFDYSSQGSYFITICTDERKCTLSRIITVGDGFPVPQLTDVGLCTQKYIEQINETYPGVFIDKYVIMPNHIHLLIYLAGECETGTGDPSPTIGNVIGWLKYTITKQVNINSGQENGKVFQRSYHDHIVRNERSYKMISDYIDKNPITWKTDCFYQEIV